MQVTVNERLGCADEFLPKARRGNFERRIAAKGRDDLVQLRGSVTITGAHEVRIGENKIYADAHQRFVCGEERNSIHLMLERTREVGREEAGAGDVLADIAREILVAASRNQSVPQDDVGR